MLDTALMDALARRPPIWAAGAQDWWDFNRSGRAKRGVGAMPAETRASDGFAQNEAGVWVRRSANTRSMAGNGLLTYPTRTNSLRNNTMAGAAVGTPGTLPTNWAQNNGTGLTRTIVGAGTVDGVDYVDIRFAGTTGDANGLRLDFESTTQIAATSGQVWALSTFFALVGGSFTNVGSLRLTAVEQTAAGAFVASQFGSDIVGQISATLARQQSALTLAGGGTVARVQPAITLTMANGVAVDFTLRIGWPQMELGAFASPPILTSGSAVTANGPQQVIDIGSRASGGFGGVIQVDLRDVTSTFRPIFMANDGTVNNYVILYANRGSNIVSMFVVNSTVAVAQVDLPVAPAIGMSTYEFGVGEDFAYLRRVGDAAPSPDTSVAFPTTLSKFALGGLGYAAGSNNYQITKRLALWYGRMSQHFIDSVIHPRAQLLAQVA